MTLLLFLIAAGVLGYFIARSKYSQNIDDAAGKVVETSKSWTKQAEGVWHSKFRKGTYPKDFRSWVSGPGEGYFPNSFRSWLNELSEDEAKDFTSSLNTYSNSLGYNLNNLVEGEYDKKPALMQVFVEAVVVYSQEYRKAREAQLEAKQENTKESVEKEEGEPKVAEKASSRRRSDTGENAEAVGSA